MIGDRVPRFSVPPFNNIMYATLFLTADLNVETIKKQLYLPKVRKHFERR